MFHFSRFVCVVGILLSLCFTMTAYGQKPVDPEPAWYDNFENKAATELYVPDHITKKPGNYTITDWSDVIDETWGWGLPKNTKLSIFDNFWETIDEEFASFVNHPDYYPGFWDDLRDLYRTEIENGDPTYGVSRGRFAAILNHLSMALKDSHTRAFDVTVNQYTALNPGVPLLVVGQYGENGHFGAGLTPLADSSLLVYKVVDDHPLGLERGDIVLGYDGIPWKDLYQELLDAELPIYFGYGWGNRWGSCESAFGHSWLMSAGMNWHLFDTIDIVKYGTDDTLHLSTTPLIGQNMELLCTEQMDIPGVPMPDIDAGFKSSYGIIEGTSIGYIYVWSWAGNIEEEFYTAVNSLMNDYETTGLIIDFRLDYWGFMHLSNKGFGLLFNSKEPLVGWAERTSPFDPLSLTPINFTYFDHIYGSPLSCYDKPIAVLTGSGSFSVGDFIAYAMKNHPMARFFGKPVSGAMNYFISYNTGSYSWSYSKVNTYAFDDPGNYLTHWELEVDEDVWLTPDDVALGYDTVVEAAKDWINGSQGTEPDVTYDPASMEVSVEYGQIATEDMTIANNGSRHLFYSLTPECSSRPDLRRQIHTNNDESQSIVLGHGGIDDFGHIWVDSDQPHGPSFEWVDISGDGTPVNLSNNSFAGPINMGFEFPFFENSYSELYIGSNGLLTFGQGTTDYSNDNVPDVDPPNNFIAPWWDDFNPSMGGAIYYYRDMFNSRFIVSYVSVPRYYQGQRIGRGTCEAIISPDGSIRFNYLSMEMEVETIFDVYSATVGIENSDGSDGLEIYFDAPYTIDNYSILITADWLCVSPYSSHIAPGENEVATVTLSAKHLPPGEYSGNIYLESNDPDEPSIVIPVSLEVTGGCDYVIGDFNGSGVFNVADIVDGYSKLKTGSPEPAYECECPYGSGEEWAVAMDVNNSCAFNVADIVDGYSKLKTGSPELEPCEECPPPGWEPAPDRGKEDMPMPMLGLKKNTTYRK